MNDSWLSSKNNWRDWICLVCVAVVSGSIILVGARHVGPTFDEPTYLECGLKGWREGTHKPLMRLGTMPLPVDVATLPMAAIEWAGVHTWDLKRDFDSALRIARATTLVFWWLLLVAVFGVSRNLCGRKVAWMTVVLICLEPTLTSHAALATTDIASLSTILLAWWAHLEGRGQSTFRRLVVPGVAYGLALFAKASALAFVPLLIFSCDLVAWWMDGRSLDAGRFRNWLRERLAMVGIGVLTVFLMVGSDWGTEPTFVKWARSIPDGLLSRCMVFVSENLRIFTNAGEGLAQQIKHNLRGHGAYLLGYEAPRAFFWYFPVLLSIKLTASGLILLGTFLATRSFRVVCPTLGVAFCILFLFSLNCRVQIGVRLIFPLFILAYFLGAIALSGLWSAKNKWIRAVAISLLLAQGAEGFSAYPQGIMFANAPWRGIGDPDWMMSDSNYDWGQGIPLAKRMIEQQDHPLGLLYFGTDPAAEDPAWFRRLMPKKPDWDSPEGIRNLFAGKTILVGASIARGGPLGKEFSHFREAIQELDWRTIGCMHMIAFPLVSAHEADLGLK